MASGPRSAVGGFSTGISPWTYLLNQTQMIAHYLRLTFWPRALVVFYGWPVALTLRDVLPYALLVTLLLAATIAALVRAPALGFLGAWFFITLAPTSSIVPIATEVGAERRMYLPLLAVIVLVVAGLCLLWRRLRAGASSATVSESGVGIVPRAATLLATVVLAIVTGSLALGTVARNREYASAVTLARTVVERRPRAVTHHYLAEQLAQAGLHDEASRHLREAVAGGDSRARYLLGIELFNAGKLNDAMEQLYAFVATSKLPYRLVPHWLEPPPAEVITARLVLARAASMQGGWSRAAEQARLVLAVAPANRDARMFLADALFAQQRYDEAGAEYLEYLKVAPGDAHVLINLGITHISAGRLDEAIPWFRRAVEAEPRNANARRVLATALLDRGDVQGAAAQAREGVALSPNDPAMRDLLTRALSGGKATRLEKRMADIKPINPWTWQEQFSFSQAIEVTGGQRVLYCAGQTSVDADGRPMHAGDMAAQIGQALDNLETVLSQAHLTFANVVRLNYYTTNVAAFMEAAAMLGTRLRAAGCVPSATLLGVAPFFIPTSSSRSKRRLSRERSRETAPQRSSRSRDLRGRHPEIGGVLSARLRLRARLRGRPAVGTRRGHASNPARLQEGCVRTPLGGPTRCARIAAHRVRGLQGPSGFVARDTRGTKRDDRRDPRLATRRPQPVFSRSRWTPGRTGFAGSVDDLLTECIHHVGVVHKPSAMSDAFFSILVDMRPHRSLAVPANVDELISRIGRLDPACARQWGTMTPHEMLCHLADSFLAVLGERPASSAETLLSRTVVKWIALHTSLPWPQGLPTRPEVDQKQGGTRPVEFERDRKVVVDLIHRFVTAGDAMRWAPGLRRDDAGRVDALGLWSRGPSPAAVRRVTGAGIMKPDKPDFTPVFATVSDIPRKYQPS